MKKILIGFSIIIALSSCSKDEQAQDLTVHSYQQNDTELDMLNKINHLRDSLGLGEVFLVQHASYKCYEHNIYMIDNNVINHDFFYDRSTNIENVCHATKVGEIIAYNYQTNKSALMAWMNSTCHDTILRSEFSRIGISISQNPTNNRKYYTVIFFD